MQFQITTLENIKLSEVLNAFNSAFADYFVKITLTEKNLAEKIMAENILLEKSVGAFADDKLVGFILLAIDEIEGRKTAYNGGTGVLPAWRGNRLTSKMYEFILPKLQTKEIYFQQLEVVTQNQAAIRVYEKIGFKKARTLACFKGNINPTITNPQFEIKILDELDGPIFTLFWNSSPSWQNSLSAIGRTKDLHKIIGAFAQETLVGYLIYTATGRIKQFAVKQEFRHSGLGQTLFAFAKSELGDQEIVITNLDKNDRESILFLGKLGLTLFLEQFEMTLEN